MEGKFHKGKYDIYLRDSGGEGGNGFGSRFSWCQGITIHLGKLTLGKASWLQGEDMLLVHGLVAKEKFSPTGNYIWG